MDIFEEFLENHKNATECRALICSSYKTVYQNDHHTQLEDNKTNTELATYGDAALKLALCELFLDKVKELTEYKKEFETDKFLIETVAKHYNLLDYIKFDINDPNITKDYIYKDNNGTKYIATTVEAVLGEIYRKNKDMNKICNLVKSWTELKNNKN